jgi:hypothetical protein
MAAAGAGGEEQLTFFVFGVPGAGDADTMVVVAPRATVADVIVYACAPQVRARCAASAPRAARTQRRQQRRRRASCWRAHMLC